MPWSALGGLVGLAAAGAALGAATGLLIGAHVKDSVFVGAMVGMGAFVAWMLYTLMLLLVLWFAGVSPLRYASAEPTTQAAHGSGDVRQETDRTAWRQPGAPMVPASLAAFFIFMACAAFWSMASGSHNEKRYKGPEATAPATVLRWDDGRFGIDDRQLIVRYLGNDQTITRSVRVKDLPDYVAVPDPGETLSVEYLIWDARTVRPAGAGASKADDISFWRGVGFTMVACALLAGIAFAIGQIRAPREHRH